MSHARRSCVINCQPFNKPQRPKFKRNSNEFQCALSDGCKMIHQSILRISNARSASHQLTRETNHQLVIGFSSASWSSKTPTRHWQIREAHAQVPELGKSLDCSTDPPGNDCLNDSWWTVLVEHQQILGTNRDMFGKQNTKRIQKTWNILMGQYCFDTSNRTSFDNIRF